MFWGKIIKAIPFLLQVILVIAAVVLFAFFDPFGIFMPTKLKLKDTPVDVQSIREIGQLITAEYYGEVIGSYAHEVAEQQDTTFQIYRDQMAEYLEFYVQEINELSEDFKANELKRNKILTAYQETFKNQDGQPDFENLLYYIANKRDMKARHLDEQLRGSQKRKLIRNAVKNGYDETNPIHNTKSYLADMFQLYGETLTKEQTKKMRKHNLVMLGRGWVKAGFDFGSFTNKNFKYNRERKHIYFIGFNPEILSATINPWFIPEEGVEGFEFLIVERKVKRDYKVVQLVKQRCLDELIRKAHEREILLKSIENAKESLKEFFTLIMDEEINEIVFYDNELDYTYHEIVKNDTITGEELLLIEHLLAKQSYEGVEKKDILLEKLRILDSLTTTKNHIFFMEQHIDTVWSPAYTMIYSIGKNGTYDQLIDAKLLNSLSKRYCDYSTITNSIKFSCDLFQHQHSQVSDLINVFIARDSGTMDFIQMNFESISIDTVFNEVGELIALKVGKSNPSAFRDILNAQLIKDCVNCSQF